MVTPSAEMIEMAVDGVQNLPAGTAQDQIRELHEAVGSVSIDFDAGYTLGLQTARTWITGAVNPHEL